MASKMVLVFVVMVALVCTSTARKLGDSAINDEKDVIIVRDRPYFGGGIGEGIGEESGYRYEGGVREGTGIIGGGIPWKNKTSKILCMCGRCYYLIMYLGNKTK